jgi:hypothetical protein
MLKARRNRTARKSLRFESLENRWLLAGLFCLLAVALHSPDVRAGVKVFLMVGSSNMWGQGFASEVPAPLNEPRDDIWIWQDDLAANVGWTPLRPGFGNSDNNLGSGGNHLRCDPDLSGPGHCGLDRIGPELTLGRALADAFPNDRIALLKHVRGGGTLSDWNPDSPGPMGEAAMYVGLRHKFDKATQVLKDSGLSYEVAGMFWDQGGADARDQSGISAQQYEANLTNIIASVREDFAMNSNMPFVLGRSHTYLPDDFGFLPVVRNAQENVANSDPRVGMVYTDDISRRPFNATFTGDHWHYDTAGQFEFGRRFASAFLAIAAEPAGDFNRGGNVDAADYVAWRDGLGRYYTQDDFDVWRANFGFGAVGTAMNNAVPEPAALKLLILAITGLWVPRLRKSTLFSTSFPVERPESDKPIAFRQMANRSE